MTGRDRLTSGNGIIRGLMSGTLFRRVKREETGKVAPRVALEVVVEIADGISLMRTQCLVQGHMTDLLTHKRRVYDL